MNAAPPEGMEGDRPGAGQPPTHLYLLQGYFSPPPLQEGVGTSNPLHSSLIKGLRSTQRAKCLVASVIPLLAIVIAVFRNHLKWSLFCPK